MFKRFDAFIPLITYIEINMQGSQLVQCPYCWETIEIAYEHLGGSNQFVEDCHVCCQPILFTVQITEAHEDFETVVTAQKENE